MTKELKLQILQSVDGVADRARQRAEKLDRYRCFLKARTLAKLTPGPMALPAVQDFLRGGMVPFETRRDSGYIWVTVGRSSILFLRDGSFCGLWEAHRGRIPRAVAANQMALW